MKHTLLTLSLLLIVAWLSAQVILTPLGGPETMVACGDAETYSLSIINSDNTGHGNVLLTADMPTGMEYVPGSLTGIAEEFNLSNISQPIFRIVGLPATSSFEISFQTIINCEFANERGILYSTTINGTEVNATEQPLANFFFPEVAITDFDFPILNLAVGVDRQREFTVVQSTNGARLDSLYFVNTYEAGMQTDGPAGSVLVGSGTGVDTFLLAGAALPGGDGSFDGGDTLRLVETVRLVNCTSANSTVQLFWQCGQTVCQEFTISSLLTQASGSPDLRITNTTLPNQTVANNPALVGGGFCDTVALVYRLENLGEEDADGAGAVYDLIVGLGLNFNLFSNSVPADNDVFPNWEIQVSINGTPINLGNFQHPNPNPLLGYNISFAQFATDPDGPGGLDDVDGDGFFDDLPIASQTELLVEIIYDPYATDGCVYLSGFPYNGGSETILRMGYRYQDQCNDVRSYWYSVDDPGANVVSLFTHRQITYTVELENSNLFPGQTTSLEIKPDGAWNSPCAATDSFLLEVVLPDGLVATGNAFGPGNFGGIVRQSGDTVWLASNERGTFVQNWGLDVMIDCSETIQDTTINLSFLYFCDPNCGPMKRTSCTEIVMDYMPQCEPCLEGIDTRAFNARRLNYGWTNAAHTERVDPTTDPTINTAAAINFDSVALELQGVFRGNGPFDGLSARIQHLGMDPTFADPTQSHFNFVGSQLTYFATDGTIITCDEPNPLFTQQYFADDNEHELIVNIEPFFQPGGCLESITRNTGDSLVYTLYTIINENTPRRATAIPDLTGELYLLQNGQEITCSAYLAPFVLEEVVPNANLLYTTQEHYGCEAIYFDNNSVVNPGHLYDADQFPNEIRSIVDVQQIQILLEGDWAYEPGSSDILANGSFDENDVVSVTAPFVIEPIADPVVTFDGDFTTLTYVNPGDWPAGDLAIGGSNPIHNVRFYASPGCSVPENVPFTMRMRADMIRYLNSSPEFRDTITSTRTIAVKTILKPTAEFLPASPQIYIPDSDTVTWDVIINNNTSYGAVDKLVRNAWVAVESSPEVNVYEILDVTDPNNPVNFPLLTYDGGNSYWIQAGDVVEFSARTFRINGTYIGCDPQELVARMGYSCTLYPEPDPAAGYQLADTPFICPTDTLLLSIRPTGLSLSVNIEGPPLPAPLCESLTYQATVSNFQLPTAYENELSTLLPLGATIVPGSSRIEFPAGSGNWLPLNDPQDTGTNEWRWDLINDPNGLLQLPGVDQSPSNSYRIAYELSTSCGLNAGLRIGFRVAGENSCGARDETIAYSEKLIVEGLPGITNTFALAVDPVESNLQACDTSTISGKIINLGPLPTTDFTYAIISLPATFDLTTNGEIDPFTESSDQQFNSRRLLQLKLPEGVPVNDSIVFDLSVQDVRTDLLSCDSTEISLAIALENDVECATAPGGICEVLYVLNTDTVNVVVEKDRFDLQLLEHTSVPNGTTGETLTTVVELTNLDDRVARTDSVIWFVYSDQNANGLIDPATDINLFTSASTALQIPANGSWTDTLLYDAPTEAICNLLLGYQTTGFSCLCDTAQILDLPTPLLANAGPDTTLCSGTDALLGIDERQLVGYEWTVLTGPNTGVLAPLDEANATFSTQNFGTETAIYQLELATNRGPLCRSADTVVITVQPQLHPFADVTSNYNGQDIACFGGNNGSVAVGAFLSTAPLQISIDTFAPTGNTVFTDLAAGTYTFSIVDANACTADTTATLTQPDSLTIALTESPISCANASDGALLATVTGGTPGYGYAWNSSPANTANLTNLATGNYQVTATDLNGCTVVSDTLLLDDPPPFGFVLTTDSTSCSYSLDGTATLDSLSGGALPLVVSWENGSSALTNGQLGIGPHQVILTDQNNCANVIDFTIPGPLPVDFALLSLENVSCAGDNDGTLHIAGTGGTAPYTFAWNNNLSGDSISLLPAGNYQATVTDAYGCTFASPTYALTQPAPLQINLVEQQNVRCFGENNGRLATQAQGGTAPYIFNWEQGANTSFLNDLAAASYELTLVDAKNCETNRNFTITQPLPLTADLRVIPPACNGEDGRFTFTTEGGTPTYRYSSDGGTTFGNSPSLAAEPGEYDLVVEDANGCQFAESTSMSEPLAILLDVPEEIIIDYGDSIDIVAQIANVREDTIIEWLPRQNQLSCWDCLTPTLYADDTQVFRLRVTDGLGCTAERLMRVIVERPRRLYMPNAFHPLGDNGNDILFPQTANEVRRILRFEVYNRWGSQVFAAPSAFPPNDPSYGWNGTLNGKELPPNVYVYLLEVEYTDGEILIETGDVVLLR
ncbi:MAG: gliding motility-associated C-terminal domain-containing protein [Bacteroidota bacterium]